MRTRLSCRPCVFSASLFLGAALAVSWSAVAEAGVWTDPEVALREDADFAIQGEYLSVGEKGVQGAQVVAMGNGAFEMYLLAGGLPGAGWNPGNERTLLKGERREGAVHCADAEGARKAVIADGGINLTDAGGLVHVFNKVERMSPTLGAKPPEGALVLFDGTTAEHWQGGRMENGLLLATGITSKQEFRDYSLHLEFRTPYMPAERGQKRGNSGVYYGGRWETQILDSFGLDPAPGHCGGIYSIAAPPLNMGLPPLVWQTYDVDFTAAKFDEAGNRTAWPRITVRLNGVLVHDDLELNKDFTPAAPIDTPLDKPEGPIFLQDHKDPVVYRNIWIVPRE